MHGCGSKVHVGQAVIHELLCDESDYDVHEQRSMQTIPSHSIDDEYTY